MDGIGRIECVTCTHVGALHPNAGCRLNGCKCPGFAASAVAEDPAERALRVRRAELAAITRNTDRLWATVLGLIVAFGILVLVVVAR